jgi:hypothetical protein
MASMAPVPGIATCEEKAQLLHAYEIAVADYSRAVQLLSQRSGVLSGAVETQDRKRVDLVIDLGVAQIVFPASAMKVCAPADYDAGFTAKPVGDDTDICQVFVGGILLGVGLELALACDFRIAADDVELGLPEVKIGMIPGSGGTQRLARMVGLGRAKDLVMRGRRVAAGEALAIGLLTEVVPATELDAAVSRLVDELRALSPLALAMAKRVLNHAYDGPLGLGLEVEGLAYGLLRSTHDFREGVEAFGEKRPPKFEGR